MISPPQITLNDTAYFDPAHTITIENRESGSVTYSLSMDTARTIATYNNVRAIPSVLTIRHH